MNSLRNSASEFQFSDGTIVARSATEHQSAIALRRRRKSTVEHVIAVGFPCNADLDGNNATERDPTWEPIIATPMHPEYPCAHCISQGSAASVLEAFFGDAVPAFTMTSTTAPGVTRKFSRLSDYVTEVVNARVYDGVHYRTSAEVGAAMDRKNGQYAVQNYLEPIAQAVHDNVCLQLN